jgi:hypothetical protein
MHWPPFPRVRRLVAWGLTVLLAPVIIGFRGDSSVDNRADRLRAGQFITAKIELPIPKGEVAIPSSVLVEVARLLPS